MSEFTGLQIGYINPRTLKPSATEKRGDVAPRQDKHPGIPQQSEQRIPAKLEARFPQGRREQQMMELPGAQPRLS